jgi:hypothetical protein
MLYALCSVLILCIVVLRYILLLYLYFRSLFCLAMSFMCGAIGVWGASIFVRKIYRNVKID